MPNPFGPGPDRGRTFGQNLSISGSRKIPPGLPAPESIIHHWDFGDLSQLSLDTAGLVPASEHGDPIARIDDKGSDPEPLIQAVLAKRPLIDKSVHNQILAKFAAPGDVLHSSTVAGGLAAYTLAVYYYLDEPPQDEDNDVFFWDSNSELTVRSQTDQLPILLGYRIEATASGHAFTSAFDLGFVDIPLGAIVQSNSVPEQRIISSIQAAESTGTEVHNPPDNARFLGIGAFDDGATPTDEFNGRCGEVVMWDITLDLDQRNSAKNYGSSRYDIVWA